MDLYNLRRWCGYAALSSGVLLLLAGLVMIASDWVGEELGLAIALLLGVSKSLLVFVLLGAFFAITPRMPGLWFSGFLASILGTQFDLVDFFSPLGPVMLLVGLIMMAVAIPMHKPRIRMGLWVWVAANTTALGSAFLGFGLLLGAAVCVAGGARLVIGYELIRPEN